MVAPQQSGTVGATDLLSALKNLVQSVSLLAQNYLNVEGAQDFGPLTAPTVVKSSSGRIVRISVVVAGSGNGTVYDSANANTTTKPIYTIPDTIGVYLVSMPVSFGILVVPGSGGQTVSGSFS